VVRKNVRGSGAADLFVLTTPQILLMAPVLGGLAVMGSLCLVLFNRGQVGSVVNVVVLRRVGGTVVNRGLVVLVPHVRVAQTRAASPSRLGVAVVGEVHTNVAGGALQVVDTANGDV
jgi:hypothetical protein